MKRFAIFLATAVAMLGSAQAADAPQRDLYWGDTHLHTGYSPDAYLMMNRDTDPDTAYRFAKGLPVTEALTGSKVQIGTPLDFLVVSDHGEYMGVIPEIMKGNPLVANTEFGKWFRERADAGELLEAFGVLIAQVNAGESDPDLDNPEINSQIWNKIIDAAERHNEPGKFTAFIGWEWSSTPGGANLHRVVFIREGGEHARQFLPYTSFDSVRPEDLWEWMQITGDATGTTFVAIPHNSNISQGLMFDDVDSNGDPITAEYARTRMKWEPVVEVTQIKGDSEAHPLLSPEDEFADFETYEHIIAVGGVEHKGIEAGDYVRSALKRGLEIAGKTGVNPYEFGLIGSTDSHTALSTAEEDNFYGKMAQDSIPRNKAIEIIPGATGWDMSASGLVGVWAEENTRVALHDAFFRKEVYATSGPRIRLRFFGGWDFDAGDAEPEDASVAKTGYKKGVSMGGELGNAPADSKPTFIISAAKDPVGAKLDRIQIVKGWLDAKGRSHEKVYNVAWSRDRELDRKGKLSPVGNTVDLKTARYANNIGAPHLEGFWQDPDFDADERAFYYARVLQIPTPRNSLYDSIALQQEPPEGHATTIQERAYSSPIWYTPGG